MLEDGDDAVAVVAVAHVAAMHALLLRQGFWLDATEWFLVFDGREPRPIPMD
jgi:hypothetical protein